MYRDLKYYDPEYLEGMENYLNELKHLGNDRAREEAIKALIATGIITAQEDEER